MVLLHSFSSFHSTKREFDNVIHVHCYKLVAPLRLQEAPVLIGIDVRSGMRIPFDDSSFYLVSKID